jgi:PAS domain S-box-containing protein
MENALTGVCVTHNEQIVTCNQRFIEIFGFSREELSGMALSKLFHADPRQGTTGSVHTIQPEIVPSTQELAGLTKEGRIIYTRQTVSQLPYKGKLLAVRHVMDISDQRSIEDALRDSEKKLRLVCKQAFKSQEHERKRVASELHDGIGQSLSSIKLRLENTFRELGDCLPAKARLKLADIVPFVQTAIEEVRRISMDLRPAMLDDLGIEAAIAWLCREFQLANPSLRLRKETDFGQTDIGSTLSAAIFRILQEALNNIAKHANASQVTVAVKARRSGLKLSIEDNGCGFIIGKPRKNYGGFGLYSMRERAALSGGRLRIFSVVGSGTRVVASWPGGQALHLASGERSCVVDRPTIQGHRVNSRIRLSGH